MADTVRLIGATIGILIGGAAGFFGLGAIFSRIPQVANNRNLALLVLIVGAGGLAVLCGYLGLFITLKIQQVRKAKRRREKRQQKFHSTKTKSRRRR